MVALQTKKTFRRDAHSWQIDNYTYINTWSEYTICFVWNKRTSGIKSSPCSTYINTQKLYNSCYSCSDTEQLVDAL